MTALDFRPSPVGNTIRVAYSGDRRYLLAHQDQQWRVTTTDDNADVLHLGVTASYEDAVMLAQDEEDRR